MDMNQIRDGMNKLKLNNTNVSVNQVGKIMSRLKLNNTKRKNFASPNLRQSVRQRTVNTEGRRANGVNPPELNGNILWLIQRLVNKPLPVFSKASRTAWRTPNYVLDSKQRSAIRNFPNKNFVAVNLTNNQKKRVRQALERLMIQRSYGSRKMPFSQNGVVIERHPPHVQGNVSRFDIFVDGIRLTEPISRKKFYGPWLKIKVSPTGRAVPIGVNMNKAGWSRLLFEPYDY